jgi:hypothetical protein
MIGLIAGMILFLALLSLVFGGGLRLTINGKQYEYRVEFLDEHKK